MIKIGLLVILIIGLLFLFYKNRSVSDFTSNALSVNVKTSMQNLENIYQKLGSGNWLDLDPTMDCWSNSNDGGYKRVMTKNEAKRMCENDSTCRGIKMVSTKTPNKYSVWFINNSTGTIGTSKGVTCSVFKR
jgi:hypothetical protein